MEEILKIKNELHGLADRLHSIAFDSYSEHYIKSNLIDAEYHINNAILRLNNYSK
jgi:hypothetical protein